MTCSIGTELAALRGSAARAVGSDIDPVRLAMARHNLGDARRPVPRRRAAPGHPRHGGAGRSGAAQCAGGGASIHATTNPPSIELLETYRGRKPGRKMRSGNRFRRGVATRVRR